MDLNEPEIQARRLQPTFRESGDRTMPLLIGRNGVRPGPLLLLGAPGVGKGTQADALAKLWDYPKISTGEILRTNVAKGTALGIQASGIMARGNLVPDQLITEMLADRLGLPDTAAGFILDGFPRTVSQAQWLDGYLNIHRGGASLGIVSMCMELTALLERLIDRRVCPRCSTVYNTRLMPPQEEGRCDNDGSELMQRADDRPEVCQRRLTVYARETAPLIQYYKRRSKYIEVDADQPPARVTSEIVAGLSRARVPVYGG